MTLRDVDARRVGLLCLAVTVTGWGINWPVAKLILREWPPLFARGCAGLAAAVLLGCLAAVRGERLGVPAILLRRLALAAFLNVFTWMGFASIAMLWLSVAECALIIYTMPIWAMLLAWPIQHIRPTWRAIAALALALAGIGVLLSGTRFNFGDGKLPGIILSLAGAICFAIGVVTARRPLPLGPIAQTAWQVGLGCLPMLLIGLLFEHARIGFLSPSGFGLMAYMVVLPMAACYLCWFAALKRLPAAMASTTMLLVPLIGILSAAPMLGEPLGVRQVAALLLTLSGVALAVLRPDPSRTEMSVRSAAASPGSSTSRTVEPACSDHSDSAAPVILSRRE